MKSRRLTETDLANLAFKSVEVKRSRLVSIERPKPIIGSYEPFRQHNGDAFNEQYPLLNEEQAATPIQTLEDFIRKACKGNSDLLSMNIPVAQATHAYVVKHGIQARREQIRPLTLPFGHTYDFGMPMLFTYNTGRIVAAFPDLRRTQPLSETGRRFIFSAMHHRWRENYPDLACIELEHWRFANNNTRNIRPYSCSEQDLIDYDTIVSDVKQTFEIWHQVIDEAVKGRRSDDGDAGPLFAYG
jgi:hypothetical protein